MLYVFQMSAVTFMFAKKLSICYALSGDHKQSIWKFISTDIDGGLKATKGNIFFALLT